MCDLFMTRAAPVRIIKHFSYQTNGEGSTGQQVLNIGTASRARLILKA